MSRLEVIILLALTTIGFALSLVDLSGSMAARVIRGECAGVGRWASCAPLTVPPPAPAARDL